MIKHFIYIGLLATLIACSGGKEIHVDRTKAPEPGPAPTINIGEAQEFQLENGLKVIVVENHKLPRVSFQLRIDRNPVTEGEMAGLLEMAGSLMKAGTTNRTKDEINEEIDFIGARVSTSSNGIYASSLKKHMDKLLEITTDILYNPTFPEEELQKEITQAKSGLQAEQNDPNSISAIVSSTLIFGKEHPYGEVTTEETLDNIDVESVKNYYKAFFKPNISYLVIVGDITKAEAENAAKKYFGSWKSGNTPDVKVPAVEHPKTRRVAFVDRPGAVQSVIKIIYPIDLVPGSEDALKASVMNEVLGGNGFSANLQMNLREDKAYTYGAYSSTSSDRHKGSFVAFASVRNEVTDSAVTQFLLEMEKMVNQPVPEEQLELVKNKMNGAFARSLESPQTVANFALNKAIYNLPDDYYQTYLERLSKITAADVQEAARKYIKPESAIIFVVGNKDEVAEKLKPFASNGEVEFYNSIGDPAVSLEPAPAGMTAEDVLNNYIKAIGGEATLKTIKSIKMEYDMSATGAPPLGMKVLKKQPGKYMQEILMNGQSFQKTVVNGETGKQSGMMGAKELSGEEIKEMKSEISIVPELHYKSDGNAYKLLGIEGGYYKVEVVSADGETSYDYYDTKTGLKYKTFATVETPQGNMTVNSEIKNYKEVDGIKIPGTVLTQQGPQAITMTLKEAKINAEIPDSEFE